MIRLLLLASLLFSVSCSTIPPYQFVDNRMSVVWPAPPDSAKIRYLSQIQGPGDIIIKGSGKFDKLLSLVVGEPSLGTDFITPSSTAFLNDRYLLVADPAARIVYSYDLLNREVKALGTAQDVPFRTPVSVAASNDGSFYVSDSSLARVFHFSSDLNLKGELKGAKFQRPAGVSVTEDGFKIVVDVLAHRLLIFDIDDNFIRFFPNDLESLYLNRPVNAAVDREKTVYVVDSLNFRVVQYDWDGKKLRDFGEPGDSPGYLARPKGIALDSEGHIYLVDSNMDIVQIFDKSGKLLLPFGGIGKMPGQFDLPSGIFIDSKDRIFVADTYNRRIQVFQYVRDNAK